MIKCPNCARENADNFNFCLDCGYDLKAYREAFTTTTQPAVGPPPPPPPRAGSGPVAAAPPPPPKPVAPPPPAVGVAPLPPPPPPMTGGPPPPPPPPPVTAAPPPPPPPVTAAPPPPVTAAPPPPVTAAPPPPVTAAPPPPKPVTSAPPPPISMPNMPAAPPAPVAPPPPVAAPPPPVAAPPPIAAPPKAAGAGETCPACGHGNAPGVRFCGNCGKRLDGGGADAPGHARTMFMHAAGTEPVKDKLCKLVTIDQTGREGMTFTLRSGETQCGRVNGIILFDDPFVSPTHCKFAFNAGKLKVTDQNSLNGVYLRVRQERKLADGEYIRAGRQLFRFETLTQAAIQIKKADGDDSKIWGSPHPGAFGRLIQILDDGRTGEIRLLAGDRCQLGREVGDIVMPSDGFISGRHCVFVRQGPDVVVQDLGSSNGTYIRVRGEADVAHGDFLLLGNQMLRVEIV